MKFFVIFIFFINVFAQKVVIQLNWKYQFEFAGFIIAKEKGFYKEEGINVELREIDKKVDVVNFVLNHKNSFGIGDSSLISLKYIHKKPIKLLMPIYDESLYVLTAVNTNIKDLEDIKKAHVVLDQFAIKNPAIIAMLKSEKVDLHKIQIKKENFYDDIKQKGVFAFYKSNEIYLLKKHHIPYKIFDPKDYGFELYGDILFTSIKTAKENPQLTQKIINATKKGYIYAFNHINETINIILKKYNTQHFSKEKLLYEAKVLKKYLSKTFEFNSKKLQKIENMYILLLF